MKKKAKKQAKFGLIEDPARPATEHARSAVVSKTAEPAPKTSSAGSAAKSDVVPYPTAESKVKDFEEKLEQSLNQPAAKRGPGRPRKDELPAPEFAMDAALIANGLKMPFDLWAISQKLDELKLTDPEAWQIAQPVKQLLDYYLPEFPEIGIAWATLAIASYSVIATRLYLLARIRKEKKSAAGTDAKQNVTGDSDSKPKNQTGAGKPHAGFNFPSKFEPVKL